VKRDRKLSVRIATWIVWHCMEYAGFHTKEQCNAFGGLVYRRGDDGADPRVRLCDKLRWHPDSHTYQVY
jgi:hypothetical protein